MGFLLSLYQTVVHSSLASFGELYASNWALQSSFWPAVVPPPQESIDNGLNLFDYGLNDPYNDLIDDFDPYLEYGERYQNRTAFKDAFYG